MSRAQHREHTHSRILDEAMQLVVERGFEGFSMRALARRLELTPGALYRYFDGQDALIAALTAQVIDEITESVRDAAEAIPHHQPLQRIIAAGSAYHHVSRAQPNRFSLIAMLLASPRKLVPDPARARPLVEQMMAALAPLFAAFHEAQVQGLLTEGNAVDRSVLIFASLQGLLLLRKQGEHAPDLIDPDRLVHESMRAHLLGWGAPAHALQQAPGANA